MNFDTLNGYEFEEFIMNLLKKMGFSVEQTSLSGDGGVDIVAYNHNPIIKGKYLIQCKNWKSKVGQPEVRDLYGVVIAEGANKGILITTSYFTKQAQYFAENKNIELLGYDVLNDLVKEYCIDANNLNKINKKSFVDYEDFDNDKYNYLKIKIEDNCFEIKHYRNLQFFYHSYIISNKYQIIKSGLLDNYINLNNEIIKRFCSKKKNINELLSIKYRNAFLYLIKGEIYKCVDICKDIELFSTRGLGFLPPMSEKEYLTLLDKHKEYYSISYSNYYINVETKSVLLKNILLILEEFNYEAGSCFIKNLFYKEFLKDEQSFKKSIDIYRPKYRIARGDEVNGIIDRANGFFNNPRELKFSRIHIPIDFLCYSDWDYKVQYKDDIYISINDFISTYYEDIIDKINSDLEKIGILFS